MGKYKNGNNVVYDGVQGYSLHTVVDKNGDPVLDTNGTLVREMMADRQMPSRPTDAGIYEFDEENEVWVRLTDPLHYNVSRFKGSVVRRYNFHLAAVESSTFSSKTEETNTKAGIGMIRNFFNSDNLIIQLEDGGYDFSIFEQAIAAWNATIPLAIDGGYIALEEQDLNLLDGESLVFGNYPYNKAFEEFLGGAWDSTVEGKFKMEIDGTILIGGA